jgi:predicted nucleotide-binding protein (sugar kinase/HSP70/actin superfamily)
MMKRIGIPRALHFLQYYPLWKTYFEELGAEVVVSPPTNRDILAAGGKMVADVTCLPAKVYAGHVAWLRDNEQVDAVFVPAIRSVQRGALHCSKFQALPDLMHAVVPDCPRLLEIGIDAHRYKISEEEAYRRLGKQFTRSSAKVRSAWKLACKQDEGYQASLVQEKLTYPEALARLYPGEWSLAEPSTSSTNKSFSGALLNIALVGHPYCLYDDYINHDLFTSLHHLGVHIQTSEMVSEAQARTGIELTTGQKRWFYENWMSGAAGHYLQDASTAGIITVLAFTCGPDSAMVETITRRAHALERPMMSLVLDEHGSAAGMITRLEAFVDMLLRQGSQSEQPQLRPPDPPRQRIAPPTLLREIHQPCLGFPRMGTSAIPIKSLFSGIGLKVEMGPALSNRTISLGVRHSPEFICTPYKYILGNMIEMLEAGADTLLYMDGAELCRNSSYTQLLNDVLHDLGYKFRLVSTGVFEKGGIFALPQFLRQFMDRFSWSEVLREIDLALAKMNLLDELERRVQYIRPREVWRDNIAKVWEEANQRVDQAKNMPALKIVRRDLLEKMAQVEINPTMRPVKIVTTGEYYAVLEPFFNLDIERVLGKLGAEVHRSLMLGDWVKIAMVFEALGIHKSEIDQAARPYLRWNIGGEGTVTVGQAVLHARKGFDGLVELLPFTCIPEITVLNILPRIRRDLNFPIIHFILDEQSGRAGMQTRLEAFIDLLYRQRDLQSEPSL